MSDRVIELLEDESLRKKMGASSKKIAATLTEASQVKKLEKLYLDITE